MNKPWFIAYVILCVAIAIFGLVAGFILGKRDCLALQVITREIPKEVPVTQFIEKPIEVIKVEKEYLTQEVIREIPQRLADFQSVEELKVFLAEDDTNRHIILTADKEGVVKFNNRCEVYALQLIGRAADRGKRLFFIPINRSDYARWYDGSLEIGHYHAVCGAIVGNEVWYIEPQDDRCWLAMM